MANLSGYILTDAGKHLLAAANAGSCAIQITKVKLGEDAINSVNDLVDKTDLIGTNLKLLKISGTKATQNTCTIYAVVTNAGQDTNFTVRQVGVFAKGIAVENPPDGVTPEDISETLFAVAYDPLPDIIPAQNGAVNITKQFNINLLIENASSIKVTVDPTGILTSEVLEDHNQSDTAHENRFKQYVKKAGDTITGFLHLGKSEDGTTDATPPDDDNSDKVPTTGWVQRYVAKAVFAVIAKLAGTSETGVSSSGSFLGINWLLAQNGYICFGKFFGGFTLQWGNYFIDIKQKNFEMPITMKSIKIVLALDNDAGCDPLGAAIINNHTFTVWNDHIPVNGGTNSRFQWVAICNI